MRHFEDNSLGGHALIFDGPLELVEAARDANRGLLPFKRLEAIRWPGRQANAGDWATAAEFLKRPWPEAVKMVRYVADRIRQAKDLPIPKSVKRRVRFSEDDGEVDIDRTLAGEPAMYRQVKRDRIHAPMHVALITNLDSTHGFWHTNSTGVFFRSAAAIALADVLEDAGYSVEIWGWSRGLRVYPEPNSEQFLACKMKGAGDPVDYDALTDSLSDWFTTQAIVGALAANPKAKAISKGQGVEAAMEKFFNEDKTVDWYQYGIDYWVKYLDIEEGIQVYPVPLVLGTPDSAAKAATALLKIIVESNE